MTTYLVSFVSCGLLLALAVAARVLPVVPLVPDGDEAWFSDTPLDPRLVAYLRGGTYGVVLTALAELHARGAVDAGQRIRPVTPLPADCWDDELLTAVYAGAMWCTEPRLVALLPRVRRAARRLRPALVERGLLVPVRRQLFGLGLLAFAAGLAAAAALESGRQPSTVVTALGVLGLAGLAALGPRRTVAGWRVLRAERRLLESWVGEPGQDSKLLLAAMVAADGRGALELLCSRYVMLGSLAPAVVPRPEPRRVPATIGITIPAPRRTLTLVRDVYEPVSDGPAIRVRPAFRDRVAA